MRTYTESQVLRQFGQLSGGFAQDFAVVEIILRDRNRFFEEIRAEVDVAGKIRHDLKLEHSPDDSAVLSQIGRSAAILVALCRPGAGTTGGKKPRAVSSQTLSLSFSIAGVDGFLGKDEREAGLTFL